MSVSQLGHSAAFASNEADIAMRRLRSLTSIDLSRCTGISELLLLTIISNNVQLSEVELSNVQSVTDTVLQALSTHCALLGSLMVNYCPLLTDLTLLRKCTQLGFLSIAGCMGVTDANLLELAVRVPSHRRRLYVHAWHSGITVAAKE